MENFLVTKRTARYYTFGELTAQTQNIWFCLHGFGQSAQHFGQKFVEMVDEKTLIVVPEALSRFYIDSNFEKVGASWLTFEDRDHEITDFITYLDALYKQITTPMYSLKVQVTVLGFSQGAAVACRWINLSDNLSADKVILWSGWFPNGFSDLINPAKLAKLESYYVYGRDDEYISKVGDPEIYLRRMTDEVHNLKIMSFNGRHQLDSLTLQQLFG